MVELLDPGIAEGLPIEGTCRLCAHRVELGEVTRQGQRFTDVAQARSALLAWASAEGDPDLESFCAGSLCGITPEEACRRLVDGEGIETSFDVLALLFPGAEGGMGSADSAAATFTPTRSMIDGPAPLPEVPRTSPRLAPRAMAAVMLADGEVHAPPPGGPPPPPRPAPRAWGGVWRAAGAPHARERAFLDAWLADNGHDPLTEDDLRPWRPGDLGWLDEPAPLIKAMVALAYVDRQRDGTEWRVIREFARYWRYPLGELEAMGRAREAATASAPKKLWTSLTSIFVRSE